MGASGWDYRVPFAGSVEHTLVAVQEQVLASGDFIWPWEDLDPDYVDDDEAVARPSTLAELARAKQVEEFWDEGTHTILDVERVWTSGTESDFACVRPLTSAESIALFGTDRPSAGQFDAAHEPGSADDPLLALLGEKWSGRSLVIFDGGSPAEVFFWGWSGD